SCRLALAPASGVPVRGTTELMFTATVEVLGMGHAPSLTWSSKFTGVLLMSPVQQMVTTNGLVPLTLTVEPGSSEAACEVRESTSATSLSWKSMVKQKGAPLQVSMALLPMMMAAPLGGSPGPPGPVSSSVPDNTGGSLVHAMAIIMMSRMTVPISTPLASYWLISTTNTYLPMSGGMNCSCPVTGSRMVPVTGTPGLYPPW